VFTGWSVRHRLAALAALITLSACVTGMVVLTLMAHAMVTDHRMEFAAKAGRRAAHNVETKAPGALPAVAATEEAGLIQVVDEHGRVRQASAALAGLPPLTRSMPRDDDGRMSTTICGTPVRDAPCLITVGYRIRVGASYWMVYAYAPTLPWYIHPLYPLALASLTVALVAMTAYLAAGTVARALAPVRVIKEELAEITATDLGRRVPPSRHRDEIADLATTVNQTLDRLEAAVEQQRRIASDASHDLRSPLTAMRAQIEEALLHPREADWQETGQAVLASLDLLQAIVTDLLTLSRLESGTPGAKKPVDLSEVVRMELTARPRGKNIETELQPNVMVTGDRLRLVRLLTNLLDNAERHAEMTITVTVRSQDGDAVLEVQDDGAGISAEQRDIVFRRFTRLDASRNRDAGGTGLGLPIAREIAQAHGGTLHIAESDIGARFVLRLPLRNDYSG
jgi:signal transduction histidine kinase